MRIFAPLASTHSNGARRYLWMPFFVVGGLLLFMVASSTCALNCQDTCPRTCRPCCIMFADFLAFTVMAAEAVVGVFALAFKSSAKDKMDYIANKVQNDTDCDTTDKGGCKPELIRQMENWLQFIGIGSFVIAGLQVLRLIAGRGLRTKNPRERFPSNVQWEQAYDDMRTNSRRDTPYQRMYGNAGPRDPNAV